MKASGQKFPLKKRILPLLLALCLVLGVSAAAAAGPDEYRAGNFSGLAAAPDGTLLVTDVYNKIIWQVTAGRDPVPFAGVIPVPDLSGEPEGVYLDGPADAAFFMEPWAIVPFLNGYAVSDAEAHVVRYIENGEVHTLAGSGTAGSKTGSDRTSDFDMPTGLAVGDDGTLYVADTESGVIRTVSSDTGAVSSYYAGLDAPTGLSWHDGALYVAETGKSRICRIENGTLTVIAGKGEPSDIPGQYNGGYVDGPLDKALFDHPQGVAVGPDGAIYVSDSNNLAVRVIREGRVDTLARGGDGLQLPILPRTPLYLNGTLYVADLYGGGILTLDVSGLAFRDVPENAWYAEAVDTAVERGLTNGTGPDTFSPNDPVTRAMFVTMLGRMHLITDGSLIINGDATFPDVPEDAWYAGSARWAADLGVVLGVDGKFLPDRSITREQIATMFYRYARSQELDVSGSGDLSGFRDAAAVSGWAEEAVRWACGTGLMQGSDGLLDPGGKATRAQVVTLFLRFMDHYGI